MESIWQRTAKDMHFPMLQDDLVADVAIIGGGITGITTAMRLAAAGRKVVVLEAHRIGRGTTGNSTGNLYAPVEGRLSQLCEKWDEHTMRMVVQSRSAAVDFIERVARDHQIDCDFFRRPWRLYAITAASGENEILEKEFKAAQASGLNAQLVSQLPLPFRIENALRIADQAQFNPLRYVQGLAKSIASDQCQIYEQTPATGIDEKNHVVQTPAGKVKADQIVMATHTPKGFNLVQTELGPYREYGVAARLRSGNYPEGIFWSVEQDRHSIRTYRADGQDYLIAIGQKHKTGQEAHTEACCRKLEAFLRSYFDVDAIACRWSAQSYRPADGLPYIGQSAGSSDLYLATGFATDGLTYGTLAAMILSDRLTGAANPWADLYDPKRLTPAKSTGSFLKENLNVAGQYIADYLRGGEVSRLDQVKPGEGRLVKVNGEKLAVYRDEQGGLSALSPVCTHLKCIVDWNEAEKTWDCPCHGSRFSVKGAVIEGPAIDALQKKEIT